MLRKLAADRRQNQLDLALQELGRSERRLRRERAESLLALGVRQGGNTALCARADGEPLQPRSLTHEFARLVGRIKDLPRVRFHDLRHAAFSHAKVGSENAS
jgi:hypothetical protein